jgi:Protein of unknown function (DUF2807).
MKHCNALLPLVSSLIILTSCEKLVGKGPVVSETRPTAAFNSLQVSVPAETYFTQDSIFKVELQAQQNILDEMETVVIGDELKIRFRHSTRLKSHEGITIRITAPDARNLEIHGSGNMYVSGPFAPANIRLGIEGSGNITVNDVSTSVIGARIEGSGSIQVKNGLANASEARISGSGNINLSQVQVRDADARIDGSGTIRVYATDKLNARISGSGTIYYRGQPAVNSSTSGSGRVVPM